ncbi:DNA-cytosine methyltransferase [hydrothermal vent metagenome]|uniref:DNA (cytosine-5-)-methyltransferase n=1 Tax=hydrothermal vent metagenome TaxID=652676 RepID=A0A3B0ZNI7_9ZZZZ
MLNDLLTVQEVAEILDISDQYVRKLIRDGRIVGQKIGRIWMIPEVSLDEHNSPINIETTNHCRRANKTPKLKLLSFFTGAMGLDLGLEKAGFTSMLASEVDKHCRETIQTNRPEMALIGDIRDYTGDDILRASGLSRSDDVDLIAGGPPCQAFSTAGNRRGFNDERGNVFLKYIEIILDIKPKYAVIENVRGLLSAPLSHRPHDKRGKKYPQLTSDEQRGGALLHIIDLLRKGGYTVSFNLYNSANFGSPQKRERVVIICSRDKRKVPYLTPTHSDEGLYGLPKWSTFREATKGLPRKHHHVNFPEKRLKYYRMLKPGENWRSLPTKLQKQALGKSYLAGGGKTGFLRRLAWNKPAPTVVTHPAMPATDLAHPVKDRPLSIEEYKRIQEFPDDWYLAGKLLEQYKQIGNAVPISLGAAIGKVIMSHMKGKKIRSFIDFPYSRYKDTDEKNWEKSIRDEFSKPVQQELFGENPKKSKKVV